MRTRHLLPRMRARTSALHNFSAGLPRRLLAVESQLFLVVSIAAGFTLFCGPDQYPIQLWDESRLAVNATEMVSNHNLLVTHFGGKPDLWNTKPPLLIWLEAGSIALLGNTEWVFRLPTSLANLVTVSVMYWFCVRTLRSSAAGLFSALVLATSVGFANYHIAWAGDYDALLSMWQVVLFTAFFNYNEYQKSTAWWAFVLGLVGSVLTKGIAGLLCLPALAAYGLCRGTVFPLLRQRKFYAALLLFVLLVGGFYVARELAAPGYWRAVQENELQGRFGHTLNKLHGPWHFYLSHLRHGDFWPVLFVPQLLLLAWFQPDARQQRLVLWALLYTGTLLVALSVSATKAYWYAAPLYPVLALLVGLGLSWVCGAMYAQFFARRLSERTTVLLFALTVFWFPYRVIAAVVRVRSTFAENKYITYISELVATHPASKRITLLVPQLFNDPQPIPFTEHDPDSNYNPVYTYYQMAFKKEYNVDFNFLNDHQFNQLKPADTVVVCNRKLQAKLGQQFVVRAIGDTAQCNTFYVISRK